MNMLSISCEPYVSVYPMKGSHWQSHPSYAPVLVVEMQESGHFAYFNVCHTCHVSVLSVSRDVTTHRLLEI